MENNKNKKSVKFQGDMLNFCDFIQFLYLPEITTLKRETKTAADDILIFYSYLSKKIRLDFSCESSA